MLGRAGTGNCWERGRRDGGFCNVPSAVAWDGLGSRSQKSCPQCLRPAGTVLVALSCPILSRPAVVLVRYRLSLTRILLLSTSLHRITSPLRSPLPLLLSVRTARWLPCCYRCLCIVDRTCRLALSLPTLGSIAAWACRDSCCCCALHNPGALPKLAEQGPHGHGKGNTSTAVVERRKGRLFVQHDTTNNRYHCNKYNSCDLRRPPAPARLALLDTRLAGWTPGTGRAEQGLNEWKTA